MHPQKSRYVALCQQTLVLGAVFAALVPAASVVSLDVVRNQPASVGAAAPPEESALASYAAEAARATPVATGQGSATIREYSLTAAPAAGTARTARTGGSGVVAAVAVRAVNGVHATTVADTASDTTTIVSDPQQVTGYGTVGVTWEHGQDIDEGDISFQLRTRTDGAWSGWQELTYHDEHGPDAGTAEARAARPGTDEALVGHVDQVQVRAEVDSDEVPQDLKLAVIDPGPATATTRETPDIDTSELPAPTDAPTTTPAEPTEPAEPAAEAEPAEPAAEAGEGLTLAAAITATKPSIYSRAQWGADERLREQTAPSYGTVHGAFVHHTVNANDYAATEVPGIIRSIYAYHVKSRGWRDIGYNFLVDRFGRIWEGRYGGVDRNVIGAHTENYNQDSFGASAIGNFDVAQPPSAVIGAYGSLFAWKLALNGVSAAATNVRIGSTVFPSSIMGHRDTKSTACPGKYLYARIPDIRRIAASQQHAVAYAPRDQDLVGTPHPDIIARRTSDQRGVIIPTTGASGFGGRKSLTVRTGRTVIPTPDVSGDGRADLLMIVGGRMVVRRGNGAGGFGAGIAPTTQQAGRTLVTAVGDLNGDRRNDLVSRDPSTGRLAAFLGRGNGTFVAQQPARTRIFSGYDLLVGGDMTGDGLADLVGRDPSGVLWLHRGRGDGTFGARRSLGGGWQQYDGIVAGDFTKDGLTDLMVRKASTRRTFLRVNLGTGTFGALLGASYALRADGRLLGAVNAVGDGNADVVTATGSRVDVVERLPGTDLGVPVVTNLDLRNADLVLNVGDWNRDGHGDVVYRESSGITYLVLGNGAGAFSARMSWGSRFAQATMLAGVGDMTGDGRPDLMAQTSAGMELFPNNGATNVSSPIVVYKRVAGTAQVPAGRWDADTAPDVFVRNGSALSLFRGNGSSALSDPTPVAVDLAPYDWVIGVGALDVTGRSDLVVRNQATGDLYALNGNRNGTLARPRLLGSGFGGYDLAG